MKKIIVAAFVAAVLVPAALAAESTAPLSSSAFCKSNAALVGTNPLKRSYKNFGACVSAQNAVAKTSALNAANACKAERALDSTAFKLSHPDLATLTSPGTKTFDQFYGTSSNKGNGNGNGNALGKCVSLKANEQAAAAQTAEVKAAKTCRTASMKALTGAKLKYRNFGACVSAQGKPA